jgi:hypothetical protein
MTATLLKASPSAREALRRRTVSDLAALIRGRVECYPGAGLTPKLTSAENKIALARYDDAEKALREIDDSIAAYEQALVDEEMAAAGRRQDQLLAERGIDTDRDRKSGVGARHGFMWLERKGRVTGHRREAGQRWGQDYALASAYSLRSCLNDNVRGGGNGDADQVRLVEARNRLDAASDHIQSATGSLALVALMDAVCGRGESCREIAKGDKVLAAVHEAELMIALDMAAVAYDIRRER